MADENQDAPRPFDVKTVEYLLRLMTEHDLSEIDLREGDQRIRLRKGSTFPVNFVPQAIPYAAGPPAGHPAPGPGPAAGPTPPAPPAPAGPKLHEIKSELVGSFYTRPAPGKPPYVQVGSRVTPDTTVCVIVAMKVNNEIKAGCTGVIREICCKDEDFVDFDTVLFRVDTSA